MEYHDEFGGGWDVGFSTYDLGDNEKWLNALEKINALNVKEEDGRQLTVDQDC